MKQSTHSICFWAKDHNSFFPKFIEGGDWWNDRVMVIFLAQGKYLRQSFKIDSKKDGQLRYEFLRTRLENIYST